MKNGSSLLLTGMEDSLLPHINSHGNDKAMDEERRLCYVGMTRAKQQLYIVHARRRWLWNQW